MHKNYILSNPPNNKQDEAPCHPIIFPLYIHIFCYLARGTFNIIGFHFLNLHQKIQQYHPRDSTSPRATWRWAMSLSFSFLWIHEDSNQPLFFFLFLLSQFLHFLLISVTLFHTHFCLMISFCFYPQIIEMRVHMDCPGCENKVREALQKLKGTHTYIYIKNASNTFSLRFSINYLIIFFLLGVRWIKNLTILTKVYKRNW